MTELSSDFIVECEKLDKDHKRLVEMVDEITTKLDNGVTENCKKMVTDFINFTKAHFRREEKLLTKIGYPDVEKHRNHHNYLDKKMGHILEFTDSVATNKLARESLRKELIFFIMDDVITTDLDFKEFIANNNDQGL